MHNAYIKAVLEMMAEGKDPKSILDGLKNSLKHHGHEQLYGRILQGVLRYLESDSAKATTLRVASESDIKKFKQEIATDLKTLNSTDDPSIIIDETIIGGYVAEANHQMVDRSYKSRLINLYRTITS